NAMSEAVTPKKTDASATGNESSSGPKKNDNTIVRNRELSKRNADVTPSARRRRLISAGTVSTVAAISPISISAPLIRDATGNVVLDKQLLKAGSDDHYIKVTSPNGQQTRISDKFLEVLHYMNTQDNDNPLFENAERRQWKLRINEWKSKLLQQAGFFPSNNNFLGIMELKDLIEDK
ncbi:MAG TPA: hypothetical protein VM012_08190, partial [Flavitalea sp.]|nr:hypothetical protein [Flavitalea sp.]